MQIEGGPHKVAYNVKALNLRFLISEAEGLEFSAPTPAYCFWKLPDGRLLKCGSVEEIEEMAATMHTVPLGTIKDSVNLQTGTPRPIGMLSEIRRILDAEDAKTPPPLKLDELQALLLRLEKSDPPTPAADRTPSVKPDGFQFRVLCKGGKINQIRSVHYITNRRRLAGKVPGEVFMSLPDDRPVDEISCGICYIRYPGATHQPGKLERPDFWARTTENHFQAHQLSPLSLAALAKGSNGKERSPILLYVHGFNNDFEDAMLQAVQLVADIEYTEDVAAFSWPSRGMCIAYVNDRGIVEASSVGLAKVLETLLTARGSHTVSVVVHSMGNEVFLRAVARIKDTVRRIPFDKVVLAAPDVAVSDFQELSLNLVGNARRISYYHSRVDWPIRISKYVNFWSQRAGGEAVHIPGIDTIGVDGVNSSFLRLGHGYFAASDAVLTDLKLLFRDTEGKLTPSERQPGRILRSAENPALWTFH